MEPPQFSWRSKCSTTTFIFSYIELADLAGNSYHVLNEPESQTAEILLPQRLIEPFSVDDLLTWTDKKQGVTLLNWVNSL